METIAEKLNGEFNVDSNDGEDEMTDLESSSQSDVDDTKTQEASVGEIGSQDSQSDVDDTKDDQPSEPKEYVADEDYNAESARGKLWGLKRVFEGSIESGNIRIVPPSELGVPAQKFHEDMGKPEAQKLIKRLYDDQDSPFDPVDRPLGLLNEHGHVAGSERHKLEMRAEELGVSPDQLETLLDGVDLSSL